MLFRKPFYVNITPIFTFEASQSTQHLAKGIITRDDLFRNVSKLKVSEFYMREKGKSEVYENAILNNDGLFIQEALAIMKDKGLALKSLEENVALQGEGPLVFQSVANLLDKELGKSQVNMVGSCSRSSSVTFVPDNGLGEEALLYMQDLVMNMLDVPLKVSWILRMFSSKWLCWKNSRQENVTMVLINHMAYITY